MEWPWHPLIFSTSQPVDGVSQQYDNTESNAERTYLVRPIVHHGGHVPTVFFSEIHSSGTSITSGKFLTRLPNRGCVNQGCHFFNMIDNDAMIECFIAI